MADIGKELETITVTPEPLIEPFPIDVPVEVPVEAPELIPA